MAPDGDVDSIRKAIAELKAFGDQPFTAIGELLGAGPLGHQNYPLDWNSVLLDQLLDFADVHFGLANEFESGPRTLGKEAKAGFIQPLFGGES